MKEQNIKEREKQGEGFRVGQDFVYHSVSVCIFPISLEQTVSKLQLTQEAAVPGKTPTLCAWSLGMSPGSRDVRDPGTHLSILI